MGSESRDHSLVFFRLTGPGRGAVAAIHLHGRQIDSCLNRLFRPASGCRYSTIKSQSIIYGNWIANDGAGEDIIVCPLDESSVEIQCHGGEAAVGAIVDSLISTGCRPASESEIAMLVEPSVWRMDFRRALSRAQTGRTAELLLDQYNSIDTRIQKLANQIQCQPGVALERLKKIQERSQFGLHLTQPWLVVLCGAPNVGKSSLINAMVGFDRAIVHESPGTTRDVVTETTSMRGWPVELVDTAGLRIAEDRIEAMGVSRARREIRAADLIVRVAEATAHSPFANTSFAHSSFAEFGAPYSKSAIKVRNKADLLKADRPPPIDDSLLTSATSGEGVAQLIDQIEKRLVPRVPERDDLFAISVEQVDCYETVRQLIRRNEIESAARHLIERESFQEP